MRQGKQILAVVALGVSLLLTNGASAKPGNNGNHNGWSKGNNGKHKGWSKDHSTRRYRDDDRDDRYDNDRDDTDRYDSNRWRTNWTRRNRLRDDDDNRRTYRRRTYRRSTRSRRTTSGNYRNWRRRGSGNGVYGTRYRRR